MTVGSRTLRKDERRAWLRLARTENIGPATFATLIARFPDIHEALNAASQLARRGGAVLNVPSDADAAKEIAELAHLGGRIIASHEPDFPSGLAALDSPPPVIAVLGRAEFLARETVAVVGARNASALGIKFARRMAEDLGAAGLAVASGLARGIDAAAHSGALDTGTIAVVAGGVDIVYPPENRGLYDEIKKRGAVISEMPLGRAPVARHFPRRNRLISGLSRGVVVVEAAIRSGSLITANYALEQGREVFAVPGSPLDPRAKGSNRLIREGATLTESAEDVISVLRPIVGHLFHEPATASASIPAALSNEATARDSDQIRTLLAEKIGPSPVDVDELIRQCAAPAGLVLTILLEWELAARIERHPGNRVAWR